MEVYSDFFMYGSGVYQKTNLASKDHSGFHSVKIIGWGEEEGIPYWVRVLSWGVFLCLHRDAKFCLSL